MDCHIIGNHSSVEERITDMVSSYCRDASDVENWNITIDSVVHERPAFISRTHDNGAMLDAVLLEQLLRSFRFHVQMDREDDGSYTGYMEELQLVENADDQKTCITKLIAAMKDYAQDYYQEFSYWSKAPNREGHIPYVIKLLVSGDDKIAEDIVCQVGKN